MKASQIMVMLLVAVMVSLAFTLTPFYVSPSLKTLKPTDDNSVRSDMPTHSGGSGLASIWVSKGQFLEYAWIKFDLSEIPSVAEITSAKFRVYLIGRGVTTADARLWVAVCFGGTEWKQGTINWNNQPPFGEELYRWEVAEVGSGWREWGDYRLITQIQTKLKAEKQIAFVLKVADDQIIPSGATWTAAFCSREADTNQPELIIDYTVPTYKLTVIAKDQVGNPLPASVTVAGKTVVCNASTGSSPPIEVETGDVTIYAQIKVGDLTFNASKTVTVTCDKVEELIINRRFLWEFFINYTDGTSAWGTLLATSVKETLTSPIIDGYGQAYLTDATYTFSFEASPALPLKIVTVTNDGILYATIDKAKLTAKTSSKEISKVTMPEIPSVYIYSLLGVLVISLIIVVAVVRMRRHSK
jgi:hypothetical protein